MPKKPRSFEQGLTLIEMMVAMVLGIAVVGTIMAVTITSVTTSTTNLRNIRLNEELRAVMSTITRDLKRAGHWGLAENAVAAASVSGLTLDGTSGNITITGTDDIFEPFEDAIVAGTPLMLLHVYRDSSATKLVAANITGYTNATEISATVDGTVGDGVFPETSLEKNSWTILGPFNDTITLGDTDGDATTSECVLFEFDANNDGILNAGDEEFGFRLNNGAVTVRQGGTACDGGGWEALSDGSAINITRLSFIGPAPGDSTDPEVVTGVGNPLQVGVREITVTLSGQLLVDPTVTTTISETVKVRNDRVIGP